MDSIARTLAAAVKNMVPGRFEVRRATPQTHPHVDWRAYGRVREKAAALGFRHLGDVDAVSVWIDESITKRPVLAIFANKDGTEVIGHYRFAPKWTLKGIVARFLGAGHDYFDVGTNFDGGEGVSIATTNAALSSVWKSPDFIIRDTHKAGTPLETLVAAHHERTRKFEAAHRELTPTVVRDLKDAVAVADTMERRKLEWRRSFGWATKEEIAAVTKLTGPTLDQVYDAFRKLVGEDSRVAPLAGFVEAAPAATPAALQFDRVDRGAQASGQSATIVCTSCAKAVSEYFDVDGRHVCATCKEIVARANEPARGFGVFLKALIFGGGAALLGAAAYYAWMRYTNSEFALVTLVIGFMVGAAVRNATAGRGGRVYQVMAVVLTYFAVGLSFAPLVMRDEVDATNADSAQVVDSVAVSDSAPVRAAGDTVSPASDTTTSSAGAIASALAVVLGGGFLFIFALPIIYIVGSMPAGLLSAIIIGVGMLQAWKMTAAQRHTISGPYRVGLTPPPAT